jgi:hypothetical protein
VTVDFLHHIVRIFSRLASIFLWVFLALARAARNKPLSPSSLAFESKDLEELNDPGCIVRALTKMQQYIIAFSSDGFPTTQ